MVFPGPGRIGTTGCRLLAVLDTKPYMRDFGPRGEVTQPEWAPEFMSAYWAQANE